MTRDFDFLSGAFKVFKSFLRSSVCRTVAARVQLRVEKDDSDGDRFPCNVAVGERNAAGESEQIDARVVSFLADRNLYACA